MHRPAQRPATHPHPCLRGRRPGDARRLRLLLGLRRRLRRRREEGLRRHAASSAATRAPARRVKEAAYAKLPEPCEVLSKKTLTELVPKGVKSGKEGTSDDAATRGNCSWNSLDNNGVDGSQFRWLNVGCCVSSRTRHRGRAKKLASEYFTKHAEDARSVDGREEHQVAAADEGWATAATLVTLRPEEEGRHLQAADGRDAGRERRRDGRLQRRGSGGRQGPEGRRSDEGGGEGRQGGRGSGPRTANGPAAAPRPVAAPRRARAASHEQEREQGGSGPGLGPRQGLGHEQEPEQEPPASQATKKD